MTMLAIETATFPTRTVGSTPPRQGTVPMLIRIVSDDPRPLDGDARDAVEAVWEMLRPRMLKFVRSLTDDADLQDDLLQEALIRLWQVDPTRFETSNPAELRYLRTVMKNRARNYLKWGR